MADIDLPAGVRLDRWLWAARFFKTRTLAKKAIECGRVKIDGCRVKPGRLLVPGVVIRIQIGHDNREIAVETLSEKRHGASEAATLYQETEASQARRMLESARRRSAAALVPRPKGRPDKRQRSLIHRFQRQETEKS